MGNGLSSDQGSFTPHGLRDVDRFGAEQRQHDWSNPENNNQLAGAAPNNGELNSLSKFNRRQTRLESVNCGGEQINSDNEASSPNFHRISAYTVYFQKLESLAYIFVSAGVGLSSFKFMQWAPKDAFFCNRVRFGRSRLFKVNDFGTNRKRVCDFLSPIVTMVLSCTVSEIRRLIG